MGNGINPFMSHQTVSDKTMAQKLAAMAGKKGASFAANGLNLTRTETGYQLTANNSKPKQRTMLEILKGNDSPPAFGGTPYNFGENGTLSLKDIKQAPMAEFGSSRQERATGFIDQMFASFQRQKPKTETQNA